jgi:thiamine-phosphate pyrophosphorylase
LTAWPDDVLALHLVTDTAACRGRALADVVRAAIRGGVTCVQLREKALPTREFVLRARLLKDLLAGAPRRIPLIINDRFDVALASGADGVHLGQADMPVEIVRRYLPNAIIGLSVESTADLLKAREQGTPVDYLGVSPVFSTPTKTDTAPPVGLPGLAAMRRLTTLPLVAIGGIGAANAGDVLRAGADGLAVVSAICSAADPEQAARELLAIIRGAILERSQGCGNTCLEQAK